MPSSAFHARSKAAPDVVAVVRLEHHVVQRLRQLERGPGHGQACGAGRCSGRSAPRARCPARSRSPASRTARCRAPRSRTGAASSNAVVANTTWPKPTPSVRKPPGTSGDANGVPASARPWTSSTRTPHGATVWAEAGDPTGRLLGVGALDHVVAGRGQPRRPWRRTLGAVGCLEADGDGVVGRRPRCTMIRAPGRRCARWRRRRSWLAGQRGR